jgi:hypothetical protein
MILCKLVAQNLPVRVLSIEKAQEEITLRRPLSIFLNIL